MQNITGAFLVTCVTHTPLVDTLWATQICFRSESRAPPSIYSRVLHPPPLTHIYHRLFTCIQICLFKECPYFSSINSFLPPVLTRMFDDLLRQWFWKLIGRKVVSDKYLVIESEMRDLGDYKRLWTSVCLFG